MKQKKRGLVERGLSLLLTLTMLLSVGAVTAFALDEIDENVASLEAGQYIVPLLRNTSDEQDLGIKTVKPVRNRFLNTALLTIGNDGSQSLTIGVEHWSYYDNFAVLNQEHTGDYNALGYSLTTFPDGFFKSENPLTYVCETTLTTTTVMDENGDPVLDENEKRIVESTYTYNYSNGNEEAKAAYLDAGYTIAENCDEFFDFNLKVDCETEKDFDIAYITIPIENYADRIYTYSWFNCCDSTSTTIDKLFDSSIIYLDVNNIESWDETYGLLEKGKISYSVDGVNRSSMLDNGIQTFNNYQWHNILEGIFNKRDSEGLILNSVERSDNKYIGKFYIDESDLPNVSDVQVEVAFDENYYQIKQDGNDSYLRTRRALDWAFINYKDLSLLEDNDGSYIEVVFDNEMELALGKNLKLKWVDTSGSRVRTYEYLFRLRISAKEVYEKKTLTIADEETGIILSTENI